MTLHSKNEGFTIVELLIVIVVIAILGVITIISFNGIQNRARISANAASLQSAARKLKIDQVNNDRFPESLSQADGGNGLSAGNDAKFQYSVNNDTNPQTFCLVVVRGSTKSYITESSSPAEGSCLSTSASQASITSVNSNATSYANTLSAGIPHNSGDVIYIIAGGNGGSTSFNASGFTKIASTTSVGGVNSLSVLRKVTSDTDSSATVSVSRTGASSSWAFQALVVKNADTTTPEDTDPVYYRVGTGSNTISFNTTAMSATKPAGLALIGVTTDGTTTVDSPAILAKNTTLASIAYQELGDSQTAGPYKVTVNRSGSINTVGVSFMVRSQ